MSPALPDGDGVLARLGIGPHGRAWRMVRVEWPRVRAEIDGGHPSPLGLVRVRSWNPLDLKFNHQVLAYGYDLEGDRLSLRLYDPNRPGDDQATLSLWLSDPHRATPVDSTMGGRPVLAFFGVRYRARTPVP
jgi:hypothetical protein